MGSNSNVYAAEPTATGGVFAGPLGTPGPTSATSPLDPAYIDLGHIGEDGVNEATERNLEKKRNWGGKVVKVLQTEYSKIYTVTFLESLKAEVLKAIHHSDNVQITLANSSHGDQIAVKHNTKRPQKLSWVLDSIDTELNAKYRTHIPEGQVLNTGDVRRVHTDTIEYEAEIEAFADAADNHAYDWTDNGKIVLPTPALWTAETDYEIGDYVRLSPGGIELRAFAAGESGATAPTAPGLGAFVPDGSVVWQQVSA